MDDFFVSAPLSPTASQADDSVDRFAQAIAGRFNNSDRPLLTARLSSTAPNHPPSAPSSIPAQPSLRLSSPTPVTPLARMSISVPPLRLPSSSASAASSSSVAASEFTIATASSLPEIICTIHVLILDIRPHSAYSAARLPHAISLSVPSTLLKRPAFTLQKLATMLSSRTARSRFLAWSKASRILIYDADSAALHEGSNLLGLLRKFRAEGFSGDISWLQGGIQALWRDQRHLVDEEAVSEDEEETEAPGFLRARDLPLAAFQQSTTTSIHGQANLPSTSRASSLLSQHVHTNGPSSTRLAAANPFYDNIRQNIELLHGITERIPLRLSPTILSRARELPFAWLRDIAASAGRDEGTEALAMQFYRIELDEQRRMHGVMAHHTMQSTTPDSSRESETTNVEGAQKVMSFPYSIIAGIEKGTKNRYRNIWPFEHTRVRLKVQEHDDYVNASFVQPLGTRRQYIATQGPLPSTFSDFWAVVWQQNVSVIVMLTKEYEGGSIKCGKYWCDGQYGPYRLKCISTSGAKDENPSDEGPAATGGGFFDALQSESKGKDDRFTVADDDEHNHTIRRIFELSHSGHPEMKSRIINQLQYLGWPDMDVPVRPRGLLRLMFEVDDLVDRANERSINDDDRRASPALFHCSAGVGRTGAFIMIDAVLNGLRREIRKHAEAKRALTQTSKDGSSESDSEGQSESADAMDVDTSGSRDRSLAPSLPASDSLLSDPLKSPISSSTSYIPRNSQKPQDPQVTHTVAGPVVTLHVGGDKSRQLDIHVPLVPSTASPAQLRTPRPSQSKELSPISSSSNTQSLLSRSASRPLHAPTSSLPRQRPNLFTRKVLTSDFTIADADSMFTSPSPNPLFAMDVESLQPPSQQVMSSSSSGEGNMSGGDRASSASGSGSGSSSSGYMTRPIQQALARLSSADDVPGSTERSDSDSFVPSRPSLRTGSRSGSGGESASGSSAGGAGGTGGTGGTGGYSSASSLGLRSFAGLCMSSPIPSSGHSSPSSIGSAVPHSARSQQHPRQRRPSMQKPSLLALKPLHAMQPSAPETEDSEKVLHTAPAVPSRLKFDKRPSSSSVNSILSSSIPSSTDNISSILSSNPTDTSGTPLSTHGMSRFPTPDKVRATIPEKNESAFDYTCPRRLDGDGSPPLLSSLEEPIRQILEDMREQRMSLCQTLRQYVFVHNAIIEGALLIVDEERKRTGLEDADLFDRDPSSIANGVPKTQATGKRGASPTELLKEDKKGEVALAKRPSVKRGKSTSSGESTGSA